MDLARELDQSRAAGFSAESLEDLRLARKSNDGLYTLTTSGVKFARASFASREERTLLLAALLANSAFMTVFKLALESQEPITWRLLAAAIRQVHDLAPSTSEWHAKFYVQYAAHVGLLEPGSGRGKFGPSPLLKNAVMKLSDAGVPVRPLERSRRADDMVLRLYSYLRDVGRLLIGTDGSVDVDAATSLTQRIRRDSEQESDLSAKALLSAVAQVIEESAGSSNRELVVLSFRMLDEALRVAEHT